MRWWNRGNNKSAVLRPIIYGQKSKESPSIIDGTSLWLKNTSPYPFERIKSLLSFAFAAVLDYGIEIHVKGSNSSYRGRAYNGIPQIANVIDGANYLVTIGLARARANIPERISPGTKRQQRLYPDGIAVRSWEDVLMYVAAHEARHIWQFQARRTTGKQPISEVDADKYALRKLNDWRVKTGDIEIRPAKSQ